MIKCPYCGRKISEFSTVCPFCNNQHKTNSNYSTSSTPQWKPTKITINDNIIYNLIAILLAIFSIGNIISSPYMFYLSFNYYYGSLCFINILFSGILAVYFFMSKILIENKFINKLLPISLCVLSIDNIILFINSFVIDLIERGDINYMNFIGYGCIVITFLSLTLDYFNKLKKTKIFYSISLITLFLWFLISIKYLYLSTVIDLCQVLALIILCFYRIKKTNYNNIEKKRNIFCSQCGKENTDDSIYCTACGNKLK